MNESVVHSNQIALGSFYLRTQDSLPFLDNITTITTSIENVRVKIIKRHYDDDLRFLFLCLSLDVILWSEYFEKLKHLTKNHRNDDDAQRGV